MANFRLRLAGLCLFIGCANSAIGQDSTFVLKEIVISGNDRTRESVIMREIPAKKGDTLCCTKTLEKTVFNRLSGLKLFNLVNARISRDTLFIALTEKWYFWTLPRLSWADRNFNVWWQTKDPARLIYGATFYFNNIRGLNHSAYLTLIGGYNQMAEGGYSLPFRYANKGWAFAGRAWYWTNHELWYKTEDDKLQFLKLDSSRIQQNIGLEIQQKKRLNYYQRIEFTEGLSRLAVDSFALKANPDYMLEDTAQRELYVAGEYISDHRDQRDYPSNGYLFRVGVKLAGIKSLGPVSSATAYTTVFTRISHFNALTKREDLVWVKHLAIRYSSGVLPYNYRRQLGYGSDYVRGYEPYVSDGYGLVLAKTGLRKALWRNKVLNLGDGKSFQKYKKVPVSVWFNIFADAGRVIGPGFDGSNDLQTQWQLGSGAGLDLVIWYSALLRLEYSFNKMGEGYFNLSYKNAF